MACRSLSSIKEFTVDFNFPGTGCLDALGECALRTRQAHLSKPGVGAGVGVRWDVHRAVRGPGRRDESALSVPARSPIPAAAHTRAARVHAPRLLPAPTHQRSRQPGCPHLVSVPQAGRESVPWCSTGARGGGGKEFPIVGGVWGAPGGNRQQPALAATEEPTAGRCAGTSAAPGSARRCPARHASEASVRLAGSQQSSDENKLPSRSSKRSQLKLGLQANYYSLWYEYCGSTVRLGRGQSKESARL